MLLASVANAFTLTGTVQEDGGDAIEGAKVSLVKMGLSTKTDTKGKFSFSYDAISSSTQAVPGFVNINNGVLSFAQSGNTPVQIQIFDLVGNQVMNKTLYGAGSVELQGFVEAQGTYFASVKMGNAQQSIKFTTQGSFGAFRGSEGQKALRKMTNSDNLKVIAEGYDTLTVLLNNLDTNVVLKMKKTPTEPAEPQYSFGWAKGNAPVPTRGCGKTWNRVKSGSYDFQWSKGKRTIRIDIPDNYDNKKPYRLVFGMHCMGGWAGGVQQEGYYGMKPFDTDKTTIFVAPEGNGNQAPWAQDDYTLFDELLADLQSNLCIDSSRVFSSGFSYGSMFSNGLSRNHQHVLRAVAVYETADVNIWLPQHTGKPIAWMGVLGLQDNLCTPAMGRSARNTALKYASAEGKDATKENATEYGGSGPHVCYDYKDVDERFPVKWCTQNGGHIWDHKDPGQNKSWVPEATWKFFTQF